MCVIRTLIREWQQPTVESLRNLHLVHWIIPFLSLPCDQLWEVINHQHGWRPDTGFPSFWKQDTPNKNEWFSVFSSQNHHFASKITIYQYINQVHIYIYTRISIFNYTQIHTHTLQPNMELIKDILSEDSALGFHHASTSHLRHCGGKMALVCNV